MAKPESDNFSAQISHARTSAGGGDEKKERERVRVRASTVLPIEQSIETKNNDFTPLQVISLNKNCLTHSDAAHNETVMKAFKMACLNYEPSPVFFENTLYCRTDLIEAKDNLLKYCLS
jgi:hypothetical protein